MLVTITGRDGKRVDINSESIEYMHESGDNTVIYFSRAVWLEVELDIESVRQAIDHPPPQQDPQSEYPQHTLTGEPSVDGMVLVDAIVMGAEGIFLDGVMGPHMVRSFLTELMPGSAITEKSYENKDGSTVASFIFNTATIEYDFQLRSDGSAHFTAAVRPFLPGERYDLLGVGSHSWGMFRIRDLRELMVLILKAETESAERQREYLIKRARGEATLVRDADEMRERFGDPHEQREARPRIGQSRIIKITEQTVHEIMAAIKTGHDEGLASVLVSSEYKSDAFDVALDPGQMQESCGYHIGARGLAPPEPGKDTMP